MRTFHKKRLAFFILSLFMASFLSAQSVTDLAKKERARRAALKGKGGAVITNADLAKTKRKPAIEVMEPEKTAPEAQAATETANPAVQEGAAAPPAGQPAAEAKPAEPKPADQAPAEQPVLSEKDFKARLSELSARAQQTQEMIDLLTLKMNALWQEFYNLSDVKAREFTQSQIGETYEKLTKAEAEAAKAKKDLDDFLATARREGVPAIWIR